MLIPIQETPSGSGWWDTVPEYSMFGISIQIHTYQSSSIPLLSTVTQTVRLLKNDEQAGYSVRIAITPEEGVDSFIIATGSSVDEVTQDWEYLRSEGFFEWFNEQFHSKGEWCHLTDSFGRLRKRIDGLIHSLQEANRIEYISEPSDLEVSFNDQLDWVRALPDGARERMYSKLIRLIEEERGRGAPPAGAPVGSAGDDEMVEDVGG